MPNFQFPHFEFDESNVGERPNLTSSNNRIGVVAPFRRGPRGFTLVSSPEDLDNLFRTDNATGSVAVQGAMDQGARDFGIIRVMGAGVHASGTLMITGTRAFDSNTVGVRVIDAQGNSIKLPNAIPVTQNATDTATLAGLIAQEMSLLADLPVNGTSDGVGKVDLRASFEGSDGNLLSFQIYLGREIADAFDQLSLADGVLTLSSGSVRFEDAVYTYAGGTATFVPGTAAVLVAKIAGTAAVVSVKPVDHAVASDEAIVGTFDGAAYTAYATGHYAAALGLTFNPAPYAAPVFLANGVNGPRAASLTVNTFRYVKTPVKAIARAVLSVSGVAPAAAQTITLTFTADTQTRTVAHAVQVAENTPEAFALALIASIAAEFDDDLVTATIDPEDDTKVLLRSEFAWDLAVANTDPAGYLVAASGDLSFTHGNQVVLGAGVVVFQGTELTIAEQTMAINPAGCSFVYNSDPSVRTMRMYPTTAINLVDSELTVAYFDGTELHLVDAVDPDMLFIEYPYEGVDGNDVRISISYVPGTRSFDLLLRKESADGEIRTDVIRELRLDVLAEINGDGYFIKALDSNMVRVRWIGSEAMRTEMPSMLTDAKLGGGYDGPAITKDDYIRAIQEMALYPVNILICPLTPEEHAKFGRDISIELIRQAETGVTENEGLRIAVTSAAPGLRPEMARGYTEIFRGNKHAVMIAGWGTYAKRTGLRRKSVDPVGFYAGHLAVTPHQASPAARTSSPFIQGLSEVDTARGTSAFEEYTKAGLDAIILDPATGGFHMLNGRTLAIDPAWYWVSIRRVYNKIRMDLFQNLQWVKSEPNVGETRLRVSTQVDNYLGAMRLAGVVADFAPTKCNEENNPQKIVRQGLMVIDIAPAFIYPADYPLVKISRMESISIPTAGV